jgi:hypothetical protein
MVEVVEVVEEEYPVGSSISVRASSVNVNESDQHFDFGFLDS